MKILITAGGTSEKIDAVRKITNSSSGLLGSIIANELVKNCKNLEKIYYLCPKNAKKPDFNDKIDEITVDSVKSVYDNLEGILKSQKIDVIIHSMAISDYTVDYVSNSEIISSGLQNKSQSEIKSLLSSSVLALDNSQKISSNQNDLIIKLKPTPKIISMLKSWSPKSILVGFKLLSNVSENELKNVAFNLLQKNNCDFVVANDISKIDKNHHKAFIIDKNKNEIIANSKEDIAQNLREIIERSISD